MDTSIPPQYCRECGIELTPETGSLKRLGYYRPDCKQCRNSKWQAEHPSSRRRATEFCLTCGVKLTDENCSEKAPGRKFPDCDECRNAQRRQRRADNPEQYRTYEAQRYQEKNEHIREQRRKYRGEHGVPKSKEYAQNFKKSHPNYQAQRISVRLARQNDTSVGYIDYAYILKRDKNICHICGQEILPSQKRHYDHVIPLSRGGTHTIDNIKVAHGVCNDRKHNKFMSELTDYDRRGPCNE